MTKKVTTKDYVVDLLDLRNANNTAAADLELKSGQYDCVDLWTNGIADLAGIDTSSPVVRGNDLVFTASNADYGDIILKDFVKLNGASSFKYIKDEDFDNAGIRGEVKVLNEDITIANPHLIDEFYADGTTVTGTAFTDEIDVSEYIAKDSKTGLTINSLGGNDNITGSNFADKITAASGNNTINAGAGNDTIVAGAGNDTVTGGLGNDTYTLGAGINAINIDASTLFGDDVINLTKGERLAVYISNDIAGQVEDGVAAPRFVKSGNDIKLTIYKNNEGTVDKTKVQGTITFKNAAAQDVVGDAGNIAVYFDNNTNTTNLREAALFTEVSDSAVSAAGTYMADFVYAAEGTAKKVTVTAGEGDNYISLSGASGGSTVTAGKGDDYLAATSGNDTVTLGAGHNEITFDLSKSIGNDVINLTKDETLELNMTEALAGQLSYEIKGNDLVISAKKLAGTTYHYEYEETTKSDVEETVTYTKDVTTFGDAVATTFKRVKGGKVYNYEKQGSKYYWVATGEISTEDTGYYKLDAKHTAIDDTPVTGNKLGSFKPADAQKELGVNTYLKTVTTSEYTAVDTWTPSGTVTEAVKSNKAIADAYHKVTSFDDGAEDIVADAKQADVVIPAITDKTRTVVMRYNASTTAYDVEISNTTGAKEDTAVTYCEKKKDMTTGEVEITIPSTTTPPAIQPDEIATVLSETELAGTVTLKNFASQNLADSVILNRGTDGLTGVDLKNISYTAELSDTKPSFTGSYLNETVTAASGTTKNLTVNTGAGDDIVTGAAGNDTFTLGAGSNVLNYDLTKGKFGNDTVNLTKDETLKLNFTGAVGSVDDQVFYSRQGNDIVVSVFGTEQTSTYYKYTRKTAEAADTATTGYKYAITYTPNVVAEYKKTEVIENYEAETSGANEGKYKKEVIEYTYAKVGSKWQWVEDVDHLVTYENDEVDGEITYTRTPDGGVEAEYVWDDANPPVDMEASWQEVTTRYAWNGTDDFDADETGISSVTVSKKKTTGLTSYEVVTTGTGAAEGYIKTVANAAETQAQKAAEGGTIYVVTPSVYKSVDSVWQWVDGTKTYSTAAVDDVYTKQAVVNGVEKTPASQDTAYTVENYDPADPVVESGISSAVSGTITLKNLALNPELAAVLDQADNSIFTHTMTISSANGGTLNGTAAADIMTVTGGSSAVFNSLAGADTITTAAKTNTFNYTAGTDTITSAGTNDTIKLSSALLTADSVFAKSGDTWTMDFDGDGNNEISYTNTSSEVYSLSINNNGTVYKTAVVDEDFENTSANTIAVIDGDDTVRYTDGALNDVVVGNGEDNVFNYNKGGTDAFLGGDGDDIYTVNVTAFSNAKNRLTIADADGDDVLNLDSIDADNLAFYFDVNKDGNAFSAAGGSDDLKIADKSLVKTFGDAHVTIKNYNGDGAIEEVNVGDEAEVTMAASINTIKGAVQNWLTRHGFDSTIDVQNNGNQYDQASLLACFNKAAITTTPFV